MVIAGFHGKHSQEGATTLKSDPSALAAAHAELTRAVARETDHAYATATAPAPPDHVVYRYNQARKDSPAEVTYLSRVGQGLVKLIRAEGYTYREAAPKEDELGCTNHRDHTVTLTPGLQFSRHVGTMIHELAHIRCHHLRRGVTGEIDRNTAEIEAESVAFLVGRALGLDMIAFSAPYCANWCMGEVERMYETRDRVIREARRILAEL